jgi:hypothetical protein
MQPEPLLYLGITNGNLGAPRGFSGVYAMGNPVLMSDTSGYSPETDALDDSNRDSEKLDEILDDMGQATSDAFDGAMDELGVPGAGPMIRGWFGSSDSDASVTVGGAGAAAVGAAGGGPPSPSSDIDTAVEQIAAGTTRPNVRNPKGFDNDGRGGSARLPVADSDGVYVTYTYHTVNPRPAGGTLDGKRVITGSDGSTWWTSDHFVSIHPY